MRTGRWAAGAVSVAVLGGLLGGCQVRVTEYYLGPCTTSPPVPHHDMGFVYLDMEFPSDVQAGSTFTITVDMMGGQGDPPPGGGTISDPKGTLGVTGAVSSPGDVPVGPTYPVTLTYTATGNPGDQITLTAIDGSSLVGTAPNQIYEHCTANAVAGTIKLT